MTEPLLHTHCVICNGNHLRELPKFSEAGLCACRDCGTVFSQKIVSEQELTQFYSTQYQRTNYLSPITVKRYDALLDGFEKFRKTNRLLDVGCGNGFFLQLAQARGWEVYGTEFTADIVEECAKKGFIMKKGTLPELGFEEHFFDLIVSIEVIEHLIDPVATAKEMFYILRPGGGCYITTPNFNSLLRYRLGAKYDVIRFPLHLIYFTPRTLNQMFAQLGFRKEKVLTTGYSKTRILTSKGKSNQQYVSETSDDEMLRYRIEKRWYMRWAKNSLNALLNLFKVGDSIKALYIKP